MSAFSEPVLSGGSASSLPKLFGLPSLDSTYGAYLLGAFSGLLSLGILVNQIYRYCRVYGDDRKELINRIFVFSLLTLDALGSAVNIHTCYTYLITDYFNPLQLLSGVWSIKIQPMMAGVTVLICQSFFSRRVYLLSKRYEATVSRRYRILVVFSLILTMAMLGFAVVGTVIAFKYQTFAQYQRFYWMDSAASACALSADCLTAGVLITTLRSQRSPYKKTRTMLRTVMVYTINTGLLTGLINIMALSFALAQPNTMVWAAIEMVAVRLYSNSVLAVLNSRQDIRDTADNSGPQDLELELQSATQMNETGSQDKSRLGQTPSKSTLGGWPWASVIQIARDRSGA